MEKLLRSRFGPDTFSIDLDRQLVRVRLVAPQTLDVPALVDGFVRNNVGVAAVLLEVDAAVAGDEVRIPSTGQVWRLSGTSEPGPATRRTLRFAQPDDPARLRAEVEPR